MVEECLEHVSVLIPGVLLPLGVEGDFVGFVVEVPIRLKTQQASCF